MSALLEVTGLRSGFGPTTVLHGVDLAVQEHELSAVLGLNGAGKSVTLKVIGGLVPAWGGRVVFDGEDVTNLTVEQRVARGMAFVPQGRQLFPDLTVTENLRLGAYVTRRRDRGEADRLQRELFDLFPRLAERRDQLAGTMSGGEQAMLAVARALMAQPKLLLVDEPSAGLSPLVAGQVFDLLKEVHASGVAVLLVEQNVALALRIAHTAHVMQRGRVVHESAVASLDHDALARHLGVGRLLGQTLTGARAAATNGAAANGAASGAATAADDARARRRARRAAAAAAVAADVEPTPAPGPAPEPAPVRARRERPLRSGSGSAG